MGHPEAFQASAWNVGQRFPKEAVTAPPSSLELPLDREDIRWRHEVSGPFQLGVNPPSTSGRRAGVMGSSGSPPLEWDESAGRSVHVSARPLSPGGGAAGQWLFSGVVGARGVLGVVRLKEAGERHVARRSDPSGSGRVPSAQRSARKRVGSDAPRWQSRGGRGGPGAPSGGRRDSTVEGALSLTEE